MQFKNYFSLVLCDTINDDLFGWRISLPVTMLSPTNSPISPTSFISLNSPINQESIELSDEQIADMYSRQVQI